MPDQMNRIHEQPEEDVNIFSDLLDDNEPTSRWTAKASVFTSLFSEAEYTFQLYRALHPDDTTTTKDDLILSKGTAYL